MRLGTLGAGRLRLGCLRLGTLGASGRRTTGWNETAAHSAGGSALLALLVLLALLAALALRKHRDQKYQSCCQQFTRSFHSRLRCQIAGLLPLQLLPDENVSIWFAVTVRAGCILHES
ncbi:MAG: hypothetical protein ABI165_04775 [Bryobacteraceae bacterium]